MDWGGYLSEGAGGAALGASLGSVIPGLGTGIGALAGGGLGLLHHFLSPADQPYKAAEEQTKKGWDEAQNYQKPFIQGGLDQYGRLNQATGDLLNPEGLENKWAAGYQQSPYTNYLLSQNQARGMDAAQQAGLGGSSAAIQNIQQGAGDIAASQRQQYMNDLMQKYMQGIGLGQNLYGVGATTAGNLGEQANTQGLNRALLSYGQGAANQNLFGTEIGLAGNLLAKQYLK